MTTDTGRGWQKPAHGTVTWVVAADGERALFFHNDGMDQGLVPIPELIERHTVPDTHEMMSDKQGSMRGGLGTSGSGAMLPRNDPHELEEKRFIEHLAKELNEAALAKRFAPKPLVRTGLGVVFVSILMLLTTIEPELDNAPFLIAMGVLGIGMGLIVSQLGNVVQSAVGDADRSEAGGLQSTAQQLGSSLGTAFLGAIVITGAVLWLTAPRPSLGSGEGANTAVIIVSPMGLASRGNGAGILAQGSF